MRVIRAKKENKRIGYPSNEERLDILEDIVSDLVAKKPADDSALAAVKAKMDQLDIDYPDFDTIFKDGKEVKIGREGNQIPLE